MGDIQVLSDEVSRQIAAGEVIDRPYSVLRELIDNAIDAGARNVQTEINKGGLKRIRVRDDGAGMDENDLRLCTLRHATSKIVDPADLTHVQTLGFRGEALASIGVCSAMSLISRRADNLTAHQAQVHFGRFGGVRPTSGLPGTTIEVTSLFHELPARRRFLKTQGAETGLCRRTLIEKALPHPDIRFDLTVDGKQVLKLSKSNLINRVAAAGKLNANDMTLISGGDNGLKVNAVVARPEQTRRDRSAIHIYLNRRRINDFGLIQAIEYGYGEFLSGGLHPIAFLFIQIDPDMVDFNVHPAKREVRLRRPGQIHQMITSTLQHGIRRWQTTRQTGTGSVYRDYTTKASQPSASTPAKQPPASSSLLPITNSTLSFPQPETTSIANISRNNWTGSAPNTRAPLLYLGQAFQLFLVAEVDDRIYFVDQHAAHERVLYEQLRSGDVERQKLIVGLTLSLSSEEAAVLRKFFPDLAKCGFRIDNISANKYIITEIPVAASRLPADHICQFMRLNAGTSEDLDRELYSHLACRMAIKEGEIIDDKSAQILLERSFRINPQRCPHGRPLWFEISRAALEGFVCRPLRHR